MIDKGLIGKEGQIDKVVKEVEMIEEHALDKIHQTRINLAKKKPKILDPIRENQKNLEVERLERRFNESQANSKATMTRIQKDNLETSKELERISRMEDPIKMMEEKKEQNRILYQQLKSKLSQMGSTYDGS